MKAAAAGYSGTPLAKKLGIAERSQVFVSGAPAGYRTALEPLPDSVQFLATPTAQTDVAHVFVTRRDELTACLSAFRSLLPSAAALWVSWPKRTSGVATEVNEHTIRDVALPMGFVDVKVCAVDETWSGLKLVVRRELR